MCQADHPYASTAEMNGSSAILSYAFFFFLALRVMNVACMEILTYNEFENLRQELFVAKYKNVSCHLQVLSGVRRFWSVQARVSSRLLQRMPR